MKANNQSTDAAASSCWLYAPSYMKQMCSFHYLQVKIWKLRAISHQRRNNMKKNAFTTTQWPLPTWPRGVAEQPRHCGCSAGTTGRRAPSALGWELLPQVRKDQDGLRHGAPAEPTAGACPPGPSGPLMLHAPAVPSLSADHRGRGQACTAGAEVNLGVACGSGVHRVLLCGPIQVIPRRPSWVKACQASICLGKFVCWLFSKLGISAFIIP